MPEPQKSELNPAWNYKKLNSLLRACIGQKYGDHPEERLEEIRNDRAKLGHIIRRRLDITKEDNVLDIGSGCGFVTSSIAPHAKHVYCADISQDFLSFCREELGKYSNITYCLMEYAGIPQIESDSVKYAFSTAVFIHFNYYDFSYYLAETNRILAPLGKVLFDFLNADSLSVTDQASFRSHMANYPSNRQSSVFNIVHPFSYRALENLVPQIGFRVSGVDYFTGTSNVRVVLEKTRDVKWEFLQKNQSMNI